MVFSRCVRTGKTTGLSCVPEKHALNNPSSHLLKDGYENCVGVQYNLLGEGDGGASVIVPNQQEGLQLGSGQASSDLQLLLEDWRLQNDAPDGLGDGGHVMFELDCAVPGLCRPPDQPPQHAEAHSDSQLLQAQLLEYQQTKSFSTGAAGAAAAAAAADLSLPPASCCSGTRQCGQQNLQDQDRGQDTELTSAAAAAVPAATGTTASASAGVAGVHVLQGNQTLHDALQNIALLQDVRPGHCTAPGSNCLGRIPALPAAALASALQPAGFAGLSISAAGALQLSHAGAAAAAAAAAAAQPAQAAGKGTAKKRVSCFPPAAAAVLCNAGDAQPDLQAKVQGVQRSRRRGRARKKLHSSIRTQQQLKLLEQQHQAVLAQYSSEASKKKALRQRLVRVIAAHACHHRPQPSETPALAAAEAAAGSAADVLPCLQGSAGGLDAVAAYVQQYWTKQLSQLADLLPLIDSSYKRLSQQQPKGQGQGHEQGQGHSACMQDPLLVLEGPCDEGMQAHAVVFGSAAAGTAAASTAALAACSAWADPPIGGGSSPAQMHMYPVSTPAAADRSAGAQPILAGPSLGSSAGGASPGSSKPQQQQNAAAGALAGLGLPMPTDVFLGLAGPSEIPRFPSNAQLGGNTDQNKSPAESLSIGLNSSTPTPGSFDSPQEQHKQLQMAGTPMDFTELAAAWNAAEAALQQQSLERTGSSIEPSFDAAVASAAAWVSAGAVYDGLWGMFQRVAELGPGLLYRTLAPQVAHCTCRCSAGWPDHAAAELLIPPLPAPAAAAAGCSSCAANPYMAIAGSAGCCDHSTVEGSAAPAAASEALPTSEHWQHVRNSLGLSTAQQAHMQQLWTKLQAEHGCCLGKRQPLLQLLQKLDQAELLGVTQCVTCFGRDGVAGLTERLLVGVNDSLADDFGVLLETSRAFWGDKSPLTLVQKAKCLVGAYPFWPDYGLLECLATSSSHQQL